MADALGTPGPPAGPGVVSALDHRLDQAGMIATQGAGMAVRTGVMHGPGTTALVTGTSATAPMTYAIAAHHWVSTRGTADGVYQGATEAAQTVATTATPGANSRIDVIWEKQQDQYSTLSPDATSAPQYGVTQGGSAVSPVKPTIPVGALELATAVVAVGATSTNGANVTITNTAQQTVARGARVPVRNLAERDALTRFQGLEVYRLDTGQVQLCPSASGTTWLTVYDPAPPWTDFPLVGTPFLAHTATIPANPPKLQYRVEDRRVFLRGWAYSANGFNAGSSVAGTNPLSTSVPTEARPAPYAATIWPFVDGGTTNGAARFEIGTDGRLYSMRTMGAAIYYTFEGISWPLG